jgi:hypothetical protein
MYLASLPPRPRASNIPWEPAMKLQLMTFSILAYTALAIACICYAELVFP